MRSEKRFNMRLSTKNSPQQKSRSFPKKLWKDCEYWTV